MPTQLQIQNTILSAQYAMAVKVLANSNAEAGGNFAVNWWPAAQYYLNIQALQRQLNLGDYTSSQCLSIYDCLNKLLGYNTAVNTVDPNYQPPSGGIIVVNPATYLSPVVLTYADLSDDNSPGPGQRNTYYNSAWRGVNPFMALTSPQLTGLEYGSDYTLLPSGGFILSGTGNLPYIQDGQLLTIYSYAVA